MYQEVNTTQVLKIISQSTMLKEADICSIKLCDCNLDEDKPHPEGRPERVQFHFFDIYTLDNNNIYIIL